MKGRKPEITALPGALDRPPPAPAWLPKFAKKEWARVVPALVKARSLASHELSTVESYCLAVARIRECEAVIQKQGLTYVSPTGESKRRPETTLLKENIEAARRLAAECGITPASRSKNKGGAPDNEDEDEFAGLDI
ncbi:phage terminase small subunit P27 family [Bradyrhizobium sp. SSUT112]|uniref:phage terminase small subunit P27 family n=1 Tax=Bradyrhizobium sp. SSUT112 TaxID=3040604 RepID=UPI002447D639|nr:phage terminase small subunit P27 family [Bradyrhizobium sp. SSUT112]MDH2354901.1 phage terminase small subunit P27 family [Bradyrhizobium sp. SSUT112]